MLIISNNIPETNNVTHRKIGLYLREMFLAQKYRLSTYCQIKKKFKITSKVKIQSVKSIYLYLYLLVIKIIKSSLLILSFSIKVKAFLLCFIKLEMKVLITNIKINYLHTDEDFKTLKLMMDLIFTQPHLILQKKSHSKHVNS